jgi:hypothetical protein
MNTEEQDPSKSWNVSGDLFATFFLPEDNAKWLSVLMAIAYRESPVGPYLELAYLPGRISFQNKNYWTVSNLIVNSKESEFWGRKNWAFPKITQSIQLQKRNRDYQFILQAAEQYIHIEYEALQMPVPMNLKWIPEFLRKIIQFQENKAYITQLNISGSAKFARCCKLETTLAGFPDLNDKRTLGSVCILDFKETIPEAKIIENAI